MSDTWGAIKIENIDSNNDDQQNEVNLASMSDTWGAIKIENIDSSIGASHYPIFFELTLNNDGSYFRSAKDNSTEDGNWEIDKTKSKLILVSDLKTIKYDIIQLPNSESEAFIITENTFDFHSKQFVKYKLSRM